VQGSVEALREALLKLTNDEVKVSVVASGVGGITESDANLAVTSNAIMLGFNVRADAAARRVVEERGLDLRYYSIIYELIDDVKQAISGMLSPIVTEEIIGLAEVRDVFRSSKFGAIAGCMVVDGVIKRNNPIRVLRDNVVVYEGALESLRRFKDDVPRSSPVPSAVSASRTTTTYSPATRSRCSSAPSGHGCCDAKTPAFASIGLEAGARSAREAKAQKDPAQKPRR
jgi:translation initiation factor IF-2